jgi:hypothetical protein
VGTDVGETVGANDGRLVGFVVVGAIVGGRDVGAVDDGASDVGTAVGAGVGREVGASVGARDDGALLAGLAVGELDSGARDVGDDVGDGVGAEDVGAPVGPTVTMLGAGVVLPLTSQNRNSVFHTHDGATHSGWVKMSKQLGGTVVPSVDGGTCVEVTSVLGPIVVVDVGRSQNKKLAFHAHGATQRGWVRKSKQLGGTVVPPVDGGACVEVSPVAETVVGCVVPSLQTMNSEFHEHGATHSGSSKMSEHCTPTVVSPPGVVSGASVVDPELDASQIRNSAFHTQPFSMHMVSTV